jgi:WD40 repeat protein
MVKLTPDVQRPFVNVFTQFRVQEPANSAIVGHAQSVLDKHIGKRVYRILGSVPAANFISIPKLPSESLGLVGKNLYVQLHVASSSVFVFHVLVNTKQGVTLDISVNNLNHTLRLAGLCLQYPISLSDKWSILLLQLDAILAQHTTYNFKSIKSIQFCANMHVRGALSSDNFYDMEAMPRDFAFPPRNGRSLNELYDFIPLPPMSRPAAPAVRSARPLSAPSRLSDISNINSSSVSALSKSVLRRSFDHSDLSSPLLEMQHVIGASSHPGCCLWSTDGRCVIYACASAIIVHNFITGDQRVLNGHTGDVRFLATTSDGTMLLSCQAGTNPLIRVWSLSTCMILSVIALKGSSLQCISSSPSSLNVVVVLNEGMKQTMLLYNMAAVPSGGRADLIAEFVSDVHINRVSFAPWDDSRLVTCGNRSIRLYRLHKGVLRPFSIDLRNFSSAVFLDVCHEPALSSASDSQRKCYVSTDSGLLFVVSYTSQMLERSFKLHSKAIRSIHVGTDAKHGLAIVTACDDKTCKVWPVDFSEFLAEVPQVAAVTSVCFSSDSLRVCMSAANGCVCVLDVPSKKVSVVTYSHSCGVMNVICDPHNEEIITTSSDCVMRIWDLQSHDQRFEFVAHGDVATAVCYHPTQYKFVAGFKSGLVKSFDIQTQDVEYTCNTKMINIVAVAFTADCMYLLCSGSDGRIAIIDAQRSFQVLRISSTCEPNDSIALAMHPIHHVACALGPRAGSVVVLDPQTGGKNAILLPPHGSTVSKLTFSAQGRVVIALSSKGRLVAWKVPRDLVHWQSQHLWESPQLTNGSQILSLVVSDNALLAAVGTADCKIWVWSLPHLDETSASVIRSSFKYQMFIGHSHPVTALTFSTNLKSLISCEDGPTMITWTVCAPIALDTSDIIEEAVASKELELDRFRQRQRDAHSPELRLPFSHVRTSAGAPGESSSPADSSETISEPNQELMPVEIFRSRYMQADSADEVEYSVLQPNVKNRKTPSPLARVRARSAELISPAIPKAFERSLAIPPMPPLQAPTPARAGVRAFDIHSDSSSVENGASGYDIHNDDPIVTYDDVARDSKIHYIVPEEEAGMKLSQITVCLGLGILRQYCIV